MGRRFQIQRFGRAGDGAAEQFMGNRMADEFKVENVKRLFPLILDESEDFQMFGVSDGTGARNGSSGSARNQQAFFNQRFYDSLGGRLGNVELLA